MSVHADEEVVETKDPDADEEDPDADVFASPVQVRLAEIQAADKGEIERYAQREQPCSVYVTLGPSFVRRGTDRSERVGHGRGRVLLFLKSPNCPGQP